MTRTYSELMFLDTFVERYNYLKLGGRVGQETFGFDRYLNQRFYMSQEWKQVRDLIIVRDNGGDLACPDRPIHDRVYIHHMTPMTPEDIRTKHDMILDPENLISVSNRTHNAIHYGDDSLLLTEFVERRPGDTILW